MILMRCMKFRHNMDIYAHYLTRDRAMPNSLTKASQYIHTLGFSVINSFTKA